jgi:uncharacterized RDD family membrane protein YckC
MAEVVSGEAVVLDVPVAQFPSRIIAQLIDVVVQLGVLSVLIVIVSAAQVHLNPDALAAVAVSVLVLTFIGYPCIFETLSRGKSLGKLALGLRVVSDDGGPERFRQAFVRAFFALFEIWIFTGAPALICSMMSVKGKRFGDLFAGTFVIQERLPHRPPLPPWLSVVPPPLYGWAQTLELSALQDLAAEQAASYLRRIWELNPVARDQLGQQIATAVAAQVTPPPPPGTPVVPFLSAVLAVRRHREMWRLAAQRGWPGPAGQGPYGPAPQPAAPYQAGPYPPAQAPAVQAPSVQAPVVQAPVVQAPPAPNPAAPAPAAPAVSTDVTARPEDRPASGEPGGFAPPG